MTQEDKDRFDELLKIVKRQMDELGPTIKTAVDRAVFRQERHEAVVWETLKSKLSPEDHFAMEEILRNDFNGDVEEFVKDLLIPDQVLEFWENRIRTDSIAAWVNDLVIYDVMAETAIGSNKEEGTDGNSPHTLYGSYCLHSKQSGTQPKANKNFSPDLLELCRSVLGWDIERKVTKTGKFIRGLRLRTDGDGNYPTHDYNLMQLLTDGDESGDGSGDGSEYLPDKDLSKGDGSTQTFKESLETENQLEYEQKINNEDKSFSVIPIKPLLAKDSDPSPLPVTPSVTNTNEIDEPPQPKTPPLEEGLSDQDKLSRLTKNRRHYPTLWYTGIEDIPRLLKFRSIELWFDDEQTIIAFPDGWQDPRRFALNEIEFVAQS